MNSATKWVLVSENTHQFKEDEAIFQKVVRVYQFRGQIVTVEQNHFVRATTQITGGL